MIQLNSDSIKVKENGQWSSLTSLTGPQGPKGDTGATGPQGPQGIPGYPTISQGDAGKVLAVNSGETGVEWVVLEGGLNIVVPDQSGVITLEQFNNIEIGTGVVFNGQLYICGKSFDYNNNNHSYEFYPLVYGDSVIVWANYIGLGNFYYVNDENYTFTQTGNSGYFIFPTDNIDTWGQSASYGDTEDFQLVAHATKEDG